MCCPSPFPPRYSRNFVELMEVLLQPRVVSLPAEIQAIYMQNILKIFSQALKATYQAVTLPDDDENDDDDGDRTFRSLSPSLSCSLSFQ